MAATAIADIINPEVLADQISAKFPDHLVLGGTDLVSVDDTFPLGSPGTQFKIPAWKRIPQFTPLTEGTAMTPGKIGTFAEFATVQRAGLSLEVYDTAQLVSKSDPLTEISSQFSRRAAEYVDAKLVGQLALTPNQFDNTNAGVQSNAQGTMDANVFIKAIIAGLGDNYGTLLGGGGAVIMHSKPFADLMQLGAIQNNSNFDVLKSGSLPTLLGMPIIQSDLTTTTTVSGTTNYKTFVVGRGALALFYQRQVAIEFDRDVLLQADIIAGTVHFSPHLFGWDDQTSTIVAEQNKSIHVVAINSK